MKRAIIALSIATILSGCAASGARPTTTDRPSTLDRRGLEGVLGATESQLTRMFGQPRLKVPEPPALKLQFTGTACILDTYLYPKGGSGQQQVTHIDARNSTGAEVDRAACINALKR